MYFFIDGADQSISVHKSLGHAARAALEKLNVPCNYGQDPVQLANAALSDRGVLQNLTAAFEAVADSDDQAAQELARDYATAIDNHFHHKS